MRGNFGVPFLIRYMSLQGKIVVGLCLSSSSEATVKLKLAILFHLVTYRDIRRKRSSQKRVYFLFSSVQLLSFISSLCCFFSTGMSISNNPGPIVRPLDKEDHEDGKFTRFCQNSANLGGLVLGYIENDFGE